MANTGNIATLSGLVLTDSGIDLSVKADLVNGLVPASQLPSYVDDVLEYANLAALPVTGETAKIYVTLDSNKIYRWSGSTYIEVSPTVGGTWGAITGTLSNQTDLQTALDAKVPTARTLTINGTAYDLTANRAWTIDMNPSARTIQVFTATASQTTFTVTGGYVVGLLDVFINGIKLAASEYTATNGTTVVLGTGTGLNNVVEIVKYSSALTMSNALRTVNRLTATAGQTVFTVSYNVGLVDVFYNGSKLDSTEYTATNGTSITLTTAAALNDVVEVVAYSYAVGAFTGQAQLNGTGFVKASGTTITYDNTSYLPLTGGTLTGALSATSATFSSSVTASQFLASSSSNAAIITSTGTTGYGLVASGSSGGARDIFLAGQTGFSNGFTVQYTGTEMKYSFQNGNLGIGTGSNYRLDVSNNGASGYIGVTNQAGASGDRYLRMGFGTGHTYATIQGTRLNTADDINIAIQAGGGNVGIGTTGPLSKLHVNGAVQVGYVDASNTAMEFYWNGASSYGRIQTYSSSNLALNPLGNNVGVGTSTPSSKLTVYEGDFRLYKNHIISDTASWKSSIIFSDEVDRKGAVITGFREQWNGAPMGISFETGGVGTTTERLRITSAGNVCIGGTLPLSNAALTLFPVNGSTEAILSVKANNASGSNAGIYLEAPGVVGGGMYQDRNTSTLRVWQASSNVGVQLTNNATSWGSFSDERLKDIIEPITDGLSKVNTLRTVIGRYKIDEPTKRRSFLIAQDVQKVLPEAVFDDRSDDQILSLQYTDLIPLLVNAIQELKAENDALKERLDRNNVN